MADWNELKALAEHVGGTLRDRKETIAVAETSAGGLICAALLSVPGASRFMRGGAVPYSRWTRDGLLNIDPMEMEGIRSSSEPYAALLAKTVKLRSQTDWGLSETGAAGPGGNSYGDDAGHTCVGIAGAVSLTRTLETASDDREANMFAFGIEALTLLKDALDAS